MLRSLMPRSLPVLLAMLLAAGGGAIAQVRVRTETIRPPSPALPYDQLTPGTPQDATEPPAPAGDPDVITDLARLPPAVAGMRERILKAARSGDPQKLVALMQAGGKMPEFSHTQRLDPTAIWRETYPDSEGIEALSILVTILSTAGIRTDPDTPAETYLWPYFARLPLKSLTPAQKVELFRIVTGADYREMLASGRYAFYRVGIAPDGTWRYFIAGD
jgi:hypothetical protein